MQCRKCRKEIPDDSNFCNMCGAKQDVTQNAKSRGNGQGSAYQLPNKRWKAVYTVGYFMDADGHRHRKIRTKSGFKSKRDALNYIPELRHDRPEKPTMTMRQIYAKWEPMHNASHSTMNCYAAAIKYFEPLLDERFADIEIDDLQSCMDECPKGKRTQQNMKAVAGLLYKYAIPRHQAKLNMAQYLVINADEGMEKDALPMEAVEKLRRAIGTVPMADYIVAQCYLGFRPSELLALDCKDYDRQRRCFVGGMKTEAGKNRIVTVSPKIQPIIDALTVNKISGPVFCAKDGSPLSIKSYREAFYAALDAVGVENPKVGEKDAQRRRYTPHSCRHTFATLMKQVQAPDKDKLELIGHTSTEMLRHYQDVDIDALRRITDAI